MQVFSKQWWERSVWEATNSYEVRSRRVNKLLLAFLLTVISAIFLAVGLGVQIVVAVRATEGLGVCQEKLEQCEKGLKTMDIESKCSRFAVGVSGHGSGKLTGGLKWNQVLTKP